MPRAGFEPAIPVFERPNTVRALDRAGIRTGEINNKNKNIIDFYRCMRT
jgi:predicted Ser/Thr protein kinase